MTSTAKPKQHCATPKPKTLPEMIATFQKYPKRTAILSFKKKDKDIVTFGSLYSQIQELASGLSQRGLKKGERVLVMAANSPSWIISFFAAIQLEAIAVPIDPQSEEEALIHIVKDTEAKWIFCDKRAHERLRKLFPGCRFHIVRLDDDAESNKWTEFFSKEKLRATARIDSDAEQKNDSAAEQEHEIAIIFYTSGTSGQPKGVPLTHQNILMQAECAIVKSKILRAYDRLLMPLPLYHVYPLNVGLFAAMYCGLPAILPFSLTGPEILRSLNEGKATVLIGVPRLLRSLYTGVESRFHKNKALGLAFDAAMAVCENVDRLPGFNLGPTLFHFLHQKFSPTLRLLTSGGAPIEEDLSRKLRALGWDVAVGYGLTETAPLLCLRLPIDNDLGSVGKPIDGVEIRIAEDKTAESTKHGEGEIQARGRNIFSGYLNQPKETKEAFTEDGWFKTGDLGFMKNGCLHVTGRISSTLVMEGGKKLQPEEIEKKYSAETTIKEIGVLQVEHELVALVLPETSELNKNNESKNTSADSGKEKPSSERPEGKQNEELNSGKDSKDASKPAATSEKQSKDQSNADKKKKDPKESRNESQTEASGEAKQLRDAVAKALSDASAKLPSYMQLSGFAITSEPLPRTNLGKIKRQELKERYEKAKAAPGAVEKKNTKAFSIDELPEEDRTLMENPVAEQTWDWLKKRFPDNSLTLDTNPQLDLNIDSFAWLNLSLDLQENTGVELTDEAISHITTLRDLLNEVNNAESGAEKSSPLENPNKYLSDKQKHWLAPLSPLEKRLSRMVYDINQFLMRNLFHISAEGLENLDKAKQFAIIPNHASYLDIFALCAVLPYELLNNTQIAGWSGIAFANPFNTFMSRLVRAFPIEASKSLMSSLALGAAVLQDKRNLIWFPEGERTLDGKLLRFKPGIGMILEKNNVAALPVYLNGTREALPPGAFFPRFNKITVIFGEPARPKQLTISGSGASTAERIASSLQDRVQALSTENTSAASAQPKMRNKGPKHALLASKRAAKSAALSATGSRAKANLKNKTEAGTSHEKKSSATKEAKDTSSEETQSTGTNEKNVPPNKNSVLRKATSNAVSSKSKNAGAGGKAKSARGGKLKYAGATGKAKQNPGKASEKPSGNSGGKNSSKRAAKRGTSNGSKGSSSRRSKHAS